MQQYKGCTKETEMVCLHIYIKNVLSIAIICKRRDMSFFVNIWIKIYQIHCILF